MNHSARKQRDVYVLRDPRDNAVRYVGCSSRVSSRTCEHKHSAKRCKDAQSAWIRELLSLGMEPTLEVIERDVAEWGEAEARWIAHYRARGAALVNSTDGGAGAPGYVMTEDNRRALAARCAVRSGETRSDVARRNMSVAAREAWARPGRKPKGPASEETRRRMAKAQLGKKASAETKKRMSESRMNPSDETRQKLRDAVLSRPEEQRKAFGQMNKGRVFSDEHRANMAEAARLRWARARQKKEGSS